MNYICLCSISMSELKKHDSIFSEFEKSSKNDWLEKIKKDFKNPDILDELAWSPTPDLKLDPYYDQSNIDYSVLPVIFPTTLQKNRSTYRPINNKEIVFSNLETDNELILNQLNSGAEGLILGNLEQGNIVFATLLENVMLPNCSISFNLTNPNSEILKKYLDYLEGNNVIQSSTGFVLGSDIKNEDFLLMIVELNKSFSKAENFIPLVINESKFNAESISLRYGQMLSQIVDVISTLAERGVETENIIKMLGIQLTLGEDYFLDIARIRALKYLTQKISEVYGCPVQPFPIHCTSLVYLNPDLGPHENMLKGTIAAMSATIGGCDSLLIKPANYSDPLESQVALNTLNILSEESYLDKTHDLAAGSYFVESLTCQIITKSWDCFLNIESNKKQAIIDEA